MTTTRPLPPPAPISEIAFGDALYEAVDRADWSLALDLIRRGAPVDHVVTKSGSRGNSTLLVAIERRAPLSVVDPLLRRGADPNFTNYERRAALHVAAAAKTLTKELLALLLSFGADPLAVSMNGHTPLTLVLRYGTSLPVLSALLAVSHVNYVQTRDKAWHSHTPLTVALRSGCTIEIIRLLVEFGADTSVMLEDGTTTVAIAQEYCTVEVTNLLQGNHVMEEAAVSPRELPQAMFTSFVRSMRENLALTKAKLTSVTTTPNKSVAQRTDSDDDIVSVLEQVDHHLVLSVKHEEKVVVEEDKTQ